METTVTGRHMEITPAIREYADKKVARFPRFFDRVRTVDVVVEKAEHRHYNVEVIVQADRAEPFVTKVHAEDLYAGLDQATDKVERQLADHKDLVRHRRGKAPMGGPKGV